MTTREATAARQGLGLAATSLLGLMTAAGLAFLPLNAALGGVIGIAAAAVAMFRPEYGLGIFFAMIVFISDTGEGIPGRTLTILDPDPPGLPPATVSFLLFLALLTFFRRVLLERRKSLVSTWGGVAFAGIIALGWLTGQAGGWPLEDLQTDSTRWIYPLLCFFICANILDSYQHIGRFLAIFFAACAVKAALLLAYFAAGRGFIYESYTIVSRDSAELMAFSVMLFLAAALLATGRMRGRQHAFLVLGALPLLGALLFAFRRSHWLGLVLGGLLLWRWSDRIARARFVRYALLGLALAVPLAIMGAVYGERGLSGELARIGARFTTFFDTRQHSNLHHKLEAWYTLQDLLEVPVQGLGIGSKHSPVPSELVGGWLEENQPTEVVHNGFLYIWMKLGLPGLLFILWLGFDTLRRLGRYWRDMPDSPARPLVAGLAAVFGVWLPMFLTGPVFSYRHQSYMLVLFLVLIRNLVALELRRAALEGQAFSEPMPERAESLSGARTT
ncbi:MAG: O-antigen ligase domain-containing protein [Desulfocurvibacter africanus]